MMKRKDSVMAPEQGHAILKKMGENCQSRQNMFDKQVALVRTNAVNF
jgi:hypothetical protein